MSNFVLYFSSKLKKAARETMKNDKNNNYPHHEFLYNLVVGDGIENIDVATQRLFFALGFKSKLLGTTYLKEAIKLWCDKPTTERVVMTTDVYPQIAKSLGSTPQRVERAIRNAIVDCYDNGKLVLYNDLVQSDVVSLKYKPTNGEFLSSVVSWMRVQCSQRLRQMSFLQYIEA